MKRPLKFVLVAVMAAFGSITVLSQSNAQIEKKLLIHLRTLEKLAAKGASSTKGIDRENLLLESDLLRFGRLRSTLKYDFKALAGKMYVATSPDGKFRIYSWDTQTGGTMRDFENVFQYRAANGRVYSKTLPRRKEGDVRGFSHQVFQLDHGRSRAYLANFTYVLSTSAIRQELIVYGIDGAKLDPGVKLISTRSGLHNSIGFDYDFFSVVNRPERPVTLFHFDEAAKSFRFPVVIDDKQFPSGGRVTDKFITYRFNGKYFVKVR